MKQTAISGHKISAGQGLKIFRRGDQKVREKVLLNCVAFIDCYENS